MADPGETPTAVTAPVESATEGAFAFLDTIIAGIPEEMPGVDKNALMARSVELKAAAASEFIALKKTADDAQANFVAVTEELEKARHAAAAATAAAGLDILGSSTSSILRLLDIKAPRFSGDNRASPYDFFDSIERLFSVVNATEEQVLQIMPMILSGSALAWFKPKIGTFKSLEEFKIQFIRYFAPRSEVQIARDKLNACRQTTSVRSYTCAFRTIISRIPDIQDGEIQDRYRRGLKAPVKNLLDLLNPSFKDFEELAERAEILDANMHNIYGDADPVPFTNGNAAAESRGRPNNARHHNSSQGRPSAANYTHSNNVPQRAAQPTNQGSAQPRQTYSQVVAPRAAAIAAGGPAPMDLDSVYMPAPPKLTDEARANCLRNGECLRCRRHGHLAKDCKAIFVPGKGMQVQ